jgi:hypothetical protein
MSDDEINKDMIFPTDVDIVKENEKETLKEKILKFKEKIKR